MTREEKNAYSKAWYRKNRDRLREVGREKDRAKYAADIEGSRAAKRAKYHANPKPHRARAKAWNDNNPQLVLLKNIKNRIKKYGLSVVEYEAMLEKQNNSCALCLRHQSTFKRRLSVDHCHKQGRVRALLCNACNIGLGLFGEDTDMLRRAINYLDQRASLRGYTA